MTKKTGNDTLALAMLLRGPAFTYKVVDGKQVIECNMGLLDKLKESFGSDLDEDKEDVLQNES